MNSIEAYRSGSFLFIKYKDKRLFLAISNFYKHRIMNSNSFPNDENEDEEISASGNIEIADKRKPEVVIGIINYALIVSRI